MTETAAEPNERRRIAVVSGGTRGIGEAIARALAGAGYRVIAGGIGDERDRRVHARSADRAGAARRHRRGSGRRADRPLRPHRRAGELRRHADPAGRRVRDREFCQRVLDVNLIGTMRMCVAAKPKLAAASGAIVNTASMYSFFGAPHAPAYAASKGGVAQLTKSLAVAWAPEGIRVNALAPGWIDTELTRGATQADAARSQADPRRARRWRAGASRRMSPAPRSSCFRTRRASSPASMLPVDGGYLT